MPSIGYLAFVLHAHLPFIRHPEHEFFLEEDWLYEAITETYIPLLDIFESLVRDEVPFRITMSMTPPLVSMLMDDLLQKRYVRHIERLVTLAEKEVDRTRDDRVFNKLAHFYLKKFKTIRAKYVDIYKRDIVGAFKRISDTGSLEIITCCATHGFLPLLDYNKVAARAQIQIAVDFHKNIFGKPPRGIWIAECGYFPGLEDILKGAGIKFFFLDTHGILYGTPRPRYGVFAPVYTPAGPAAFGRDIESSRSVWSQEEGYPGDSNYREFYRDIGYDLDMEYIRPYINADGTRKNTGIKYYSITGKTSNKKPYDPDTAMRIAKKHAENFMFNRERQVDYLYSILGERKPILTSPYDAELFGHWWFEGPEWLNFVIRGVASHSKILELIHPPEYLSRHPKCQIISPSLSSWGYKGYAEVWLNGSNDWIYRHLHEASNRMVELANKYINPTPLERASLNQAARELLLAQSSDWAFIMKTGTMVSYANLRTVTHINNFNRIYNDINNGKLDESWIIEISSRHNIFPDIDYLVYRSG